MQAFMNHDFNVTEIKLATFVRPGRGTSVHKNRPFHGLAMVLPGTAEKEYRFSEGRRIKVGENEIIYLPKGSDYTVFSEQSGNCYAINFALLEEVDFPPFSFAVKNAGAVLREFERATRLWQGKNTAFRMQCKAALYHILSTVQGEYQLKYTAQSTAALLSPAMERIHSGYPEEELSIGMLAERCGISEDYFRKLFKNVYGTSPRKYINELKLSHARELIRSGLYSVRESAEFSGFSDISYFSREFKKAFGSSPKNYK